MQAPISRRLSQHQGSPLCSTCHFPYIKRLLHFYKITLKESDTIEFPKTATSGLKLLRKWKVLRNGFISNNTSFLCISFISQSGKPVSSLSL